MIEIITEADYKDRLAATQNGVLLLSLIHISEPTRH